MCFSGQSSPTKLIKSPQGTSGYIWGHALPDVSSLTCSLMHSCHHAKILGTSPPSQAILLISIISFFLPNLFPPGTRQGAFCTTLSP